MKILVSPNAFKGSLSAVEAAGAMAMGVKKVLPSAKIAEVPVSDGGDGLLKIVKTSIGGITLSKIVAGPREKKIGAEFCFVRKSRTAVVEMALASGLVLLPQKLRNPLRTTTYGTGELLKTALKLNPSRIVLGIGGSATCDGGTGAASAMGVRFIDKKGGLIKVPKGEDLIRIRHLNIPDSLFPRKKIKFEIICDVENPLLGPDGAARVYGPQKGASPQDVEILEEGLANLADVIEDDLGINIRKIKGGGAAGGIGACFHALFGAELKKGIDVVLELVRLEEKMKDADLVITGEGRIDRQTAFGKAPTGVAKFARKYGVPCIAIAGSIGKDISSLHEIGISSVFSICPGPVSLDDAMNNASKYLAQTTEQAVRLFVSRVREVI